ncbi:unnamed protein product [Cunninghamella blakesleeana]
MQALSQTNDIEPPSYEESLYFKKIDHAIKNQHKWLPLNYDKKDILLVPKNEKQPLYNNHNEKSLFQQLEKIKNDNNKKDDDQPFNERLERVSSCLQQMIDEAKASLTTSNNHKKSSSSSKKNSCHQKSSSSSNIPKRPRKKLNKRKSQQELLDSQSRIANAIEQLNSTISQHISSSSESSTLESSESNTPYQILEDYYKDENRDDSRPSSPIVYHHHYHHYHHYYYPNENDLEKQQAISKKRKRSSSSLSTFSSSSSSSLPSFFTNYSSLCFWTSTVTETTLLFGIFHYILSLSKPTSFLMSISWLISLLLTKKKALPTTRAFLNHFSFFISQWLKRK